MPGSPVSEGKSAVTPMPLLTSRATSNATLAVERSAPSRPVIVMGYEPGLAPGGTSISSSAVAGSSVLVVMAWMTKPPPRMVARQPSGSPARVRSTGSTARLETSTSTLTLEPGWTSMDG